MPTLFIVRHAKSSWATPGMDDFDRPLNERGQRDLVAMADRIRTRGARATVSVVSSACRASQTAQGLLEAFGVPEGARQRDDRLYLAPPARLLTVVAEHAGPEDDVLLIAHNPGLHELAIALSPDPIPDFPTLGMAAITCPAPGFSTPHPEATRLAWYDFPKRPFPPESTPT